MRDVCISIITVFKETGYGSTKSWNSQDPQAILRQAPIILSQDVRVERKAFIISSLKRCILFIIFVSNVAIPVKEYFCYPLQILLGYICKYLTT